MRVGIIGAMDSEIKQLLKTMKDKKETKTGPATFYSGIIAGVPCVVARSGVGKVAMAACAQTMIDHFAPDLLINTGVAGGLDEKLNVGDVVVAIDLVQHDVDVTPLGMIVGQLPDFPPHFKTNHEVNVLLKTEFAKQDESICVYAGRIASGDQFINTPEQRKAVKASFDALACEMEGAALGEVCYLNNVPCCVLRAISDTGKDGGAVEYVQFEKEAAARMAHFLIAALPHIQRL